MENVLAIMVQLQRMQSETHDRKLYRQRSYKYTSYTQI